MIGQKKMSNTEIFQCARCKRIFRSIEGDSIEAEIQSSKDFPQDFTSINNYGGLHKVCIECYNSVMNQGHNSTKHERLKRFIKVIRNKITKR